MRTPELKWWTASTERAHRLVGPIILLTLLTVGTLIYLVPGDHDRAALAARPSTAASTSSAAVSTGDPADEPSAQAATTSAAATPSSSAAASTSAPTAASRIAYIRDEITTRTITADASQPASSTSPVPTVTATGTRTTTTTKTVTAPTPDTAKHCWDFTWQQDAQAAYLANLSDPWGLDGAPGPANGDGLACTQLPVDPTRPASTPADPYVPPVATAAAKQALLTPSSDYYGVTQDGLPVGTRALDELDTSVGKAPSSIGFFSYWDSGYPSAKVTAAWDRGALPVMTWMSKPSDAPSDNSYSMTNILNGNWNNYLYQFAGAIVRTGLPVVIRFDHEMNGAWYPWSAGMTSYNNTPAKYVAMWRYVWNIFQQVGANDDVIWLWSPARVDNIEGVTGTSSIAADYPGDQYVDWVGATVYWRNGTEPTDYQTSFGKTISQIRAVTQKPLFFDEIGALQSYDDTDETANKNQWITNTLNGFLADPSIVGFSWFNNVATTADDPTHAHDWRFNAAPSTLTTFADQVDRSRFAGGTMPDPTTGAN